MSESACEDKFWTFLPMCSWLLSGSSVHREPVTGLVNTHCLKNPRVRKIFCPQFRRRKWLRQFYGRLENALFLQEKPMSIKFLVLGGGYFGFGGGG